MYSKKLGLIVLQHALMFDHSSACSIETRSTICGGCDLTCALPRVGNVSSWRGCWSRRVSGRLRCAPHHKSPLASLRFIAPAESTQVTISFPTILRMQSLPRFKVVLRNLHFPATQSIGLTYPMRLLHPGLAWAHTSARHPFDTHALVTRLESSGMPRAHADVLVAALDDVVSESLAQLEKGCIGREEGEKWRYAQKVSEPGTCPYTSCWKYLQVARKFPCILKH